MKKLRQPSKEIKIPMQAYFYIPSEEEQIEINKKNIIKSQRKIFEGGVRYLPYEQEKLEELNKAILEQNKSSEQSIIFPEWWKNADSLRFLQGNNFNIKETILCISKHITWKEKNFPIELSDKVFEILNT